MVSAGMLVELRTTPDRVAIHATGPDPVLLACYPRAQRRGEHRINPAHWDGLPDGATRSTSRTSTAESAAVPSFGPAEPVDLAVLLARRDRLATPVARRDLATYQAAVLPFPTNEE